MLCFVAHARGGELDDAQKLFDTGHYAKCAELAADQVKLGIWNDRWWRLKIEIDLETGFYGDALETFELALRRWSDDIELRLLGREVYLYNGQPDKAQEMLDSIDRLVRQAPWRYSAPASRVALGRILLMRGFDARQVLEVIYDRIKTDQPEFVGTYVASGDLALEKNDFAVAANEFQRALKLQPDSADLHFKLARAFAPSNPAEAERLLKKALEINPRHSGALLFQADQLIDGEQYDEAHAVLDRVLEINEQHPLAWAYRAVLAHFDAAPQREKLCRNVALCSWRNNPQVDHLIGKKLSQHYRFKEGAEYQRSALAMDPNYLPAKFQLSQDLLRLGDEQQGWELANEVNEKDGYNVVAYNLITLEEQLARFRTLESDGFIVRMDAREAELYGNEVLGLLRKAKVVLCAKYDVPLEQPVIVEIFPEQSDFAIRTFGVPGGAGYLGVCFGRIITMNSPASQGGHPTNWKAVLWHEFCHVVTLTKTNNKMPRWLSEGISVYEELQRDPTWGQSMNPRYRQMVLDGELTPVSQLSGAFLKPASPLHVQFAYYESALVVEYIVDKYGLDVLKRVLVDLGVGMPINESLGRYSGSIAALDQEFAEFARRLAESLAPDLAWDECDAPPNADSAALAAWNNNHPKNYWGLRRWASQLIVEKNWAEAKRPLQQLIKHYPGDVSAGNALEMLATVHRELKATDLEEATLKRLVELDADAVDALARLMTIYNDREDWPALWETAQRMLAVDPLRRALHVHLSRAAEELGKNEAAIAAYKAVLQLDPIDPARAHFRLAQLLQQQGDLPAARRQVLMALEEAPRYRAALRTLLEIVEQMDDSRKTDDDAKPSDAASSHDAPDSNTPDTTSKAQP